MRKCILSFLLCVGGLTMSAQDVSSLEQLRSAFCSA